MTDLKLHLRKLEHDIAGSVLDLREGEVARRDGFDGRFVELDEVPEHSARLVERAEAVIFSRAVLLEEVVLEHARDLERDLVVLAKRRLADELDDLGKVLLLLQDLLCLRPQVDEPWLSGLIVRLEYLGVLGV
jgi:hypothetical protein